MKEKIDTETAYKAMVKFLEAYWERTGRPDAISSLLGDLNLDTFTDKNSADPTALEDWENAVKSVLNSEI